MSWMGYCRRSLAQLTRFHAASEFSDTELTKERLRQDSQKVLASDFGLIRARCGLTNTCTYYEKAGFVFSIAGSLRRGSYNRAALRAATELVPEGAILETFELDGNPVFNQDEEELRGKVTELKRRIREADAILL